MSEQPTSPVADTPAAADSSPAIVRKCDSCGQEDDHPRHTVYVVIQDPRHPDNPEKTIDLTEVKHMDCCSSDGCHDRSCDSLLRGANGVKGDEFRSYLTSQPAPEVPENEQPTVAVAEVNG